MKTNKSRRHLYSKRKTKFKKKNEIEIEKKKKILRLLLIIITAERKKSVVLFSGKVWRYVYFQWMKKIIESL